LPSVLRLIVVLAASGLAGCGGSERSTPPADTQTVSAEPEITTPVTPQPKKKRRVHITAPRDGAVYDGKMIGHVGERRAVVDLKGTAEPGASIFVAGNGDGTSSNRDDATVTVDNAGRWRGTVNAYGCGPDEEGFVEITAGYDEPYADEDLVEVEVRCDPNSAPGVPVPVPAPVAPTGPCSRIPARNFPVPPGDPRDADGDGIACEM
jgi:hypothetical protein